MTLRGQLSHLVSDTPCGWAQTGGVPRAGTASLPLVSVPCGTSVSKHRALCAPAGASCAVLLRGLQGPHGLGGKGVTPAQAGAQGRDAGLSEAGWELRGAGMGGARGRRSGMNWKVLGDPGNWGAVTRSSLL